MSTEVKHKIHYASLEEVKKKNYDKKFTAVTTTFFLYKKSKI